MNDLFTGRPGHSGSLYFGLVAEGILVESVRANPGAGKDVIVYLSYDRLADHAITEVLIDRHVDQTDPARAFGTGGGLEFVCGHKSRAHRSLIASLSTRLPEVSGRELINVAPNLESNADAKAAFFQSIVWRNAEAVSEETTHTFRRLISEQSACDEAFNSLLCVATVPNHLFNAEFLDAFLRDFPMPDRDAFWSTYLHTSYGSNGPIERLIKWAAVDRPASEMDEEIVDLAAQTLAWVLSTPNRPRRDKATKALVALLTSWPATLARVVNRFSSVDDPYVVERVVGGHPKAPVEKVSV